MNGGVPGVAVRYFEYKKGFFRENRGVIWKWWPYLYTFIIKNTHSYIIFVLKEKERVIESEWEWVSGTECEQDCTLHSRWWKHFYRWIKKKSH